MTKKFRKRISIKWILLPAVLAAAIVVPAAQADPWPFVKYENATPTHVKVALEELGTAASPVTAAPKGGGAHGGGGGLAPAGGSLNHFLTGQVATVPVVDGHLQALLDKKQTQLTPYSGAIVNGLQYQAQARYYASLSGSPSSKVNGSLGGPGSTGPGISTAGLLSGTSVNDAQPSTPQATGSGTTFQWGDAATGFGVGIGLIVLMSVVGFAVVGTRNRTAPA
jgi:hypothetical protein